MHVHHECLPAPVASITSTRPPAGTHLARGLQLLADPVHKLVRGADDDHIIPVNNVTPAGTHLARGLQLLADPAHKLVWGADDDHISPINNVTELRHGHDVFRQLNVWQVPS